MRVSKGICGMGISVGGWVKRDCLLAVVFFSRKQKQKMLGFDTDTTSEEVFEEYLYRE